MRLGLERDRVPVGPQKLKLAAPGARRKGEVMPPHRSSRAGGAEESAQGGLQKGGLHKVVQNCTKRAG